MVESYAAVVVGRHPRLVNRGRSGLPLKGVWCSEMVAEGYQAQIQAISL